MLCGSVFQKCVGVSYLVSDKGTYRAVRGQLKQIERGGLAQSKTKEGGCLRVSAPLRGADVLVVKLFSFNKFTF